jgi:hypothetical protein
MAVMQPLMAVMQPLMAGMQPLMAVMQPLMQPLAESTVRRVRTQAFGGDLNWQRR